ncbi:MAG: transposase [Saprospiraceae bacterium]|nr:transposase [Saprospiraceae bacterium]
MRRSTFTESQIIQILKSHEQGRSASDLCREHGISQPTFYKWRKQYGGMEASQVKRLRDLEEENRRLKQMYADLRPCSKIICFKKHGNRCVILS